VPTITFADGIRAVRLKLYDEERRRMVTFAQARAGPTVRRRRRKKPSPG
jgi:hypothetical protein